MSDLGDRWISRYPVEMTEIIPYESSRLEEVKRIWKEVGWILEDNYRPLELFLEEGTAHLGLQRNEAECAAITMPGEFRYRSEDLPMTIVAAVTTSLVARRQGLAGRTTAEAVRAGAERGDLLAALGVFDTGYYDRLGFASMPYIRHLSFDPAQLLTRDRVPPPRRIGKSESREVHAARLRRRRGHGSVNILSPALTEAAMIERKESLGLGYGEGDSYTHHLWGHLKGENGPFDIYWLAYEKVEQLRELLALLHSLSDQIHLVRMQGPPGIVLQDFLETPFRHQRATRGADTGHSITTAAESQMRILDLPSAVSRLRLEGELEVNLRVIDPIEKYLEESEGWRGWAGEYRLRLGGESELTSGRSQGSADLTMSIGAFTQLWSGARGVEHLAMTGELECDGGTRKRLSELFDLPRPEFDWIF